MSEFEKGMLVQHASLGLGKVVALEPKAIHVFFVGRDSRYAAKLRLPDAAALLRPADPEQRAFLGGVSAFSLDAASGRYGYGDAWIPREEALARFREAYPGGFKDPLYVGEVKGRQARPARLRRAQAAWTTAFGNGEGERRLAAGELPALVEGALLVERLAGGNQGIDKASLAPGLADAKGAAAFFAALFDYVGGAVPEQARFEALSASVVALPSNGRTSAWTLVTSLPFLARPDRDMLLRPKTISLAAHRLGLELRFSPEPNWSTYSTLLRSCERLLAELRGLGAADYVDVECFLTVVTARPGVRPAKVAIRAEAGEPEGDDAAEAREEAEESGAADEVEQ